MRIDPQLGLTSCFRDSGTALLPWDQQDLALGSDGKRI